MSPLVGCLAARVKRRRHGQPESGLQQLRTTVLLLLSYTRLTLRVVPHYGLYGDNWEPVVASIKRGQVPYIASDHLAGLPLPILQKNRQRDPSLGFARDVRFVCHTSGLNPLGRSAQPPLQRELNVKNSHDETRSAFLPIFWACRPRFTAFSGRWRAFARIAGALIPSLLGEFAFWPSTNCPRQTA